MDHTTAAHYYKERERHVRLRKALTRIVSRSTLGDGIPPICRRLHLHAYRTGRAEVSALILAACRWGEIQSIDWQHMMQYGYAYVTQTKTESQRRIHVPPQIEQSVRRHVKGAVHLPFYSRKRVQDCIEKGMRAMDLEPPSGIKSGTHVIRHLTASGLARNGWPVEDIAERLGHHDTDSTRHYIHDIAEWRTAS